MRSAWWLVVACCAAAAGIRQPASTPEQQARAACAGCHAFPPADILPAAAWRDEVVRMMFFREKRVPPPGSASVGRTVQLPPDLEQALAYYSSAAPARLPPPDAWPPESESTLTFSRKSWTLPDMADPPAVSSIQLADIDGDAKPDLVGADMRHGVVFASRSTQQGGAALAPLAIVPHPSHVTIADLDRDGLDDLLVSDLGEFFPADHKKGAVILLRGQSGGKFGAFWLDDWPRVASVRAADVNGDGRADLAVAAFGWHTTGHVAVVENRTVTPSRPDFVPHTIDPRTGSVDVVPVDLNRDGKMDLVSLLAQEHETVVAYINKGEGFAFDQRVVYTAPHPNWGSSGLHVVDLDRDGDLDVLLAHGDSFDDGIVKPYHGIQWLENTGGFPFVEHTLARMPGVHAVKAADLDGDGDLDIAAAALLAGGADVDERGLPAVVWLEQTKPGIFARHTIAMGTPRHATLDIGDLDGDGDLDIVVGNFSLERRAMPSVVAFVNNKKR